MPRSGGSALRRAVIGAIFGGVGTFGIALLVVLAVSPPGRDNYIFATIVAALLAGNTATAGAVIGAAGDIAAHFRQAFPNGQGPERDYAETASADHDPLPGIVTALRITGLVVLIVACFAFLVFT